MTSIGEGRSFQDIDDDEDLPRTLRRERDARERSQTGYAAAPTQSDRMASNTPFVPEPVLADSHTESGTTVTAINIPFGKLVQFFFKAVFAAIPAILVLGVILWWIGHLLMTYYPWLVKVQILIRVPN